MTVPYKLARLKTNSSDICGLRYSIPEQTHLTNVISRLSLGPNSVPPNSGDRRTFVMAGIASIPGQFKTDSTAKCYRVIPDYWIRRQNRRFPARLYVKWSSPDTARPDRFVSWRADCSEDDVADFSAKQTSLKAEESTGHGLCLKSDRKSECCKKLMGKVNI